MKKLSSRKKRAVFNFTKFSIKQLQLLNFWKDHSPFKNMDIIVADGAIRSGKTISMICSFLLFTQARFEGQSHIISGKSVGSLKRNVIKPMLQILDSWGWDYNYNRSENFIEIGSNTYFLFGANNESSQDSLQGLTAASALADEVALFPRSFVEQMIGRCSVEGSKIFVNCNPKSPFHYFKTEYIDKAEEKKIYYLHFTMEDNLSLAESVKERYRRMFTGTFYMRYILGKWVQAEGLVYDMFNEKKNVVETIEREYEQYYVSCDYGTQNPMVYLLWGKFKGKWYVIKEYYYNGRTEGKQKTDGEYYNDLVDFVGDLYIKAFIVDPSASSFITLVRKQGKFNLKKAKNDVLQGIALSSSKIYKEEVYINDCCKELIKEFYSYTWDEKAVERGEDKPIKEFDHCLDSFRYFVFTILRDGSSISILR